MSEPAVDAELAAQVEKLFQELGVSQRAAASRLGIDHSTLSRYKSGRAMPTREFLNDLLRQVARVRGVEVTGEERAKIDALFDRALRPRTGTAAHIERLNIELERAQARAAEAEAALSAAPEAARTDQPQLRELVYLSKTKLHETFWSASLHSAQDSKVGLAEAVEWLTGQAVAFDVRHPHQSSEWIEFDLDMNLGTICDESGLAPDDIAIFSGSLSAVVGNADRKVCLLLCGSTKHLLRGVGSAGRAGSNSGWLVELVREFDGREREEESSAIRRTFPRLAEMDRRDARAPGVALHVFDVHQRHALESGRLRGHARVIFDFDDAAVFTKRIVLATPLYVELVGRTTEPSWQTSPQRR